jgi:hypothetical protein
MPMVRKPFMLRPTVVREVWRANEGSHCCPLNSQLPYEVVEVVTIPMLSRALVEVIVLDAAPV